MWGKLFLSCSPSFSCPPSLPPLFLQSLPLLPPPLLSAFLPFLLSFFGNLFILQTILTIFKLVNPTFPQFFSWGEDIERPFIIYNLRQWTHRLQQLEFRKKKKKTLEGSNLKLQLCICIVENKGRQSLQSVTGPVSCELSAEFLSNSNSGCRT